MAVCKKIDGLKKQQYVRHRYICMLNQSGNLWDKCALLVEAFTSIGKLPFKMVREFLRICHAAFLAIA